MPLRKRWISLSGVFCALWVLTTPMPSWAQGTAFSQLMNEARHRKVVQVSTPAGAMSVLELWGEQAPSLVYVFASGGEGNVHLAQDEQGVPFTRQGNHPAFVLGVPFLQRQVGWVVFDVPQSMGTSIARDARTKALHIDAVASLGAYLKAAHPATRFVLLGHSNGGISAGMQAVRDPTAFDAVVMSAPNTDSLPWGWKAAQSRVPIFFITHQHDDCRGTQAYKTVNTAKSGDKPLVVLRAEVKGERTECFKLPAPHFYTGAEDAFADAVVNWGRSL